MNICMFLKMFSDLYNMHIENEYYKYSTHSRCIYHALKFGHGDRYAVGRVSGR